MKRFVLLMAAAGMAGCDRQAGNQTPAAPTATATPSNRQSSKAPDNSEWEKKCRAKRDEGIGHLKNGKLFSAKEAFGYAFFDRPPKHELTTAQLELMMEFCVRLEAIAIEERRDQEKSDLQQLSLLYRKDIGWDIDKFKEWRLPIIDETLAWIEAASGIK